MTTVRVAYLLAAAGALALTACSKDNTSEETSAPPPVVTEGDETQTTTSVEKWDEPGSASAKESADEKAIDDAIDPTLDDQVVQDVQDMPVAEPDLQPATPAAKTLSDAEIAKIVEVVNSGEIQQAQVAKTKAKDKQVKQFADHMIKEHRKAKQEGAKIAKEEKLVTADSSIATEIEKEGASTLKTLRSAEAGSGFDSLYMDDQAAAHQKVLNLLDERLIPSAQDPKLKAELEKSRGMVERHLMEAEKIKASLSNTAAEK
jgi:putative membrane protein